MEASKGKTPQAQLRALKSGCSELPLAYQLTTTDVLHLPNILYMCTLPCWEWHADQVANIKTPGQSLIDSLKMSREWHREPHLLAIIGKSLLNPTNLDYMDVPSDGGRVQNWIMDLVWHLLKHRAWSSVVRHTMVPDCYAGILSDDVAAQKEACDK